MNNEKPVRLEELQNRVDTEKEPQLEGGILIEAPRGWFEQVQDRVNTVPMPVPRPPVRPVH